MNAQSTLFMSFVQHSNRMLKRMDGQLSMHGISFTEFQVLRHLSQAPQETMTRIDLARSVGLTASGVTRMLAPMEKLGLVKKESHPRDARVSLVKLSDSGRQICEDTSVTVSETAAELFSGLTESQQGSVQSLLGKIS